MGSLKELPLPCPGSSICSSSRVASFTYKGRTVDVKQVGRELGVRYVLEGSVRAVARQVRITVRLIDATTGVHLWAHRFDGALEDVFSVEDEVAASVVGAIAPKLEQVEIERIKQKPPKSLDAYDCYSVGWPPSTAIPRRRSRRRSICSTKPLRSIPITPAPMVWRAGVMRAGKRIVGPRIRTGKPGRPRDW